MKRTLYLSLLAIGLVVGGCQSKGTGPVAKKADGGQQEAVGGIDKPAENSANPPAGTPPPLRVPPGEPGKDPAAPSPGQPGGEAPPVDVDKINRKRPFAKPGESPGPGQVQPPVAGAWKKTTIDPADVASKLDASLRKLKNVAADAAAVMKVPKGEGRGRFSLAVQDANTFDIQYPYFHNGDPVTATVRADGKRVSELHVSGWKPVRDAGNSKPNLSSDAIVNDWPMKFPRYVLGSIIDGNAPITTLVKALKSGKGGYNVSVESRTIRYGGLDHPSYRIVAVRKPEVAKTKGPSTLEIVYDNTLFLPTTVSSSVVPPGKKEQLIYYSFVWQNNKKFNRAKFELPQ